MGKGGKQTQGGAFLHRSHKYERAKLKYFHTLGHHMKFHMECKLEYFIIKRKRVRDACTSSFLSPTDQTCTYRKSTPHILCGFITWSFNQLLNHTLLKHKAVATHFKVLNSYRICFLTSWKSGYKSINM